MGLLFFFLGGGGGGRRSAGMGSAHVPTGVVLAAGMEMGRCLFLIAANLPPASDCLGGVPPSRGLDGTAKARSRRL